MNNKYKETIQNQLCQFMSEQNQIFMSETVKVYDINKIQEHINTNAEVRKALTDRGLPTELPLFQREWTRAHTKALHVADEHIWLVSGGFGDAKVLRDSQTGSPVRYRKTKDSHAVARAARKSGKSLKAALSGKLDSAADEARKRVSKYSAGKRKQFAARAKKRGK